MRYGGGEGDYGTPRRIPRLWGARRNETERHYPCDDLSGGSGEAWFRAVTVAAARPSVFRWLCQLKVAPYSYDLLDNLGRRSPRRLTPGAERLERGQRVMTIFRLADFALDDHLTLVLDDTRALRVFGPLTLTYAVTEEGPGRTRLVVKLVPGEEGGLPGRLRRRVLAWGDLFMMRRQLFTLRKLAENGEAA